MRLLQLYNNSTAPADDGWVSFGDSLSLSEFADLVGRVGGFILGGSSSDPGALPLLTGGLVMITVLMAAGTNRVGIIAGGVLAVVSMGVLSMSMSLLPQWIYGGVVLIVGLVAAAVFMRYIDR